MTKTKVQNKHKVLVCIFTIGVLHLFCHFNAESQEQSSEFTLRPDIEYKAEDLKDPFEGYIKEKGEEVIPESQRDMPLPSLTVQGIIWGGNLPQAIINNKVVKIGDMIEGVRVTEINKSGVTVFFGYRKYNLSAPAAAQLPKEGGSDEK